MAGAPGPAGAQGAPGVPCAGCVDDTTVADRTVRITVTNCAITNQGGSQSGSVYNLNPSGSLDCTIPRPRDVVPGSNATVRVTWMTQRGAGTVIWTVDAIPYETTALPVIATASAPSTTPATTRPTVAAVPFTAAQLLGTTAEVTRIQITPTAPAGAPFPLALLLGVVVDYQATR